MNTKDCRETFLNFFSKLEHKVIQSYPLVPQNDPTLLFTNAGMVPFKKIFTGEEKAGFKRAASSQKCVRAGGKHNDLENVGYTARHHTFFEMLGNFSFGDYFKKQAIEFAWELLIKEFKLNEERLWVTVYKDDDEAYELWNKHIKIPGSRIVRLGEKTNFWSMGDTGPCGPCSEIIFDQGDSIKCDDPGDVVDLECDRYLEIWNLVFMQYNRLDDGNLVPLPSPSIDTGMGLERISAVLAGVYSNYDIDLFKTIISALEDILHVTYKPDTFNGVALRVIADHMRAATFLIGDGVYPSNEQRSYVLRRIIRRALRYAFMIGMRSPLLYTSVDTVISIYRGVYDDLASHSKIIKSTIKDEENRFLTTFERGLTLIDEHIKTMSSSNIKNIDGTFAFRLNDTFGFPIDILSDIAKENGFNIDYETFNMLMDAQKQKARESSNMSKGIDVKDVSVYNKILETTGITEFLGYRRLSLKSRIIHIVKDKQLLSELNEGEEGILIFQETPFYPQAGGQVGDTGIISLSSNEFKVTDTFKPVEGLIAHAGKLEHGRLTVGQEVELLVDKENRKAISIHHTSTHLLQSALRNVIGSHVKQAGSFVDQGRLRFDFTINRGLTDNEILHVESMVNQWIRENQAVNITFSSLEDAVKEGAMALFDEKYKDVVRVITIDKISKELCGGTHLKRTGDIGLFIILKESSVASGVRRIEAVSGDAAYRYVKEKLLALKEAASLLKTPEDDVNNSIKKLQQRIKELEAKQKNDFSKPLSKITDELMKKAVDIKGIKVISGIVEDVTIEDARTLSDMLKGKLQTGVGALGLSINNKANIIVFVTKTLTGRFKASDIAKQLAIMIGGNGGGREDFAQAGGTSVNKLKDAIESLPGLIEQKV